MRDTRDVVIEKIMPLYDTSIKCIFVHVCIYVVRVMQYRFTEPSICFFLDQIL